MKISSTIIASKSEAIDSLSPCACPPVFWRGRGPSPGGGRGEGGTTLPKVALIFVLLLALCIPLATFASDDDQADAEDTALAYYRPDYVYEARPHYIVDAKDMVEVATAYTVYEKCGNDTKFANLNNDLDVDNIQDLRTLHLKYTGTDGKEVDKPISFMFNFDKGYYFNFGFIQALPSTKGDVLKPYSTTAATSHLLPQSRDILFVPPNFIPSNYSQIMPEESTEATDSGEKYIRFYDGTLYKVSALQKDTIYYSKTFLYSKCKDSVKVDVKAYPDKGESLAGIHPYNNPSFHCKLITCDNCPPDSYFGLFKMPEFPDEWHYLEIERPTNYLFKDNKEENSSCNKPNCNPSQKDSDQDGVGDICDQSPCPDYSFCFSKKDGQVPDTKSCGCKQTFCGDGYIGKGEMCDINAADPDSSCNINSGFSCDYSCQCSKPGAATQCMPACDPGYHCEDSKCVADVVLPPEDVPPKIPKCTKNEDCGHDLNKYCYDGMCIDIFNCAELREKGLKTNQGKDVQCDGSSKDKCPKDKPACQIYLDKPDACQCECTLSQEKCCSCGGLRSCVPGGCEVKFDPATCSCNPLTCAEKKAIFPEKNLCSDNSGCQMPTPTCNTDPNVCACECNLDCSGGFFPMKLNKDTCKCEIFIPSCAALKEENPNGGFCTKETEVADCKVPTPHCNTDLTSCKCECDPSKIQCSSEQDFDQTTCTCKPKPPVCGDGKLEAGEGCETNDDCKGTPVTPTCISKGYPNQCTCQCTNKCDPAKGLWLDEKTCTCHSCEDGVFEQGKEACDTGVQTSCPIDKKCEKEQDGKCACKCRLKQGTCVNWDANTCECKDVVSICGNGKVESEQCDLETNNDKDITDDEGLKLKLATQCSASGQKLGLGNIWSECSKCICGQKAPPPTQQKTVCGNDIQEEGETCDLGQSNDVDVNTDAKLKVILASQCAKTLKLSPDSEWYKCLGGLCRCLEKPIEKETEGGGPTQPVSITSASVEGCCGKVLTYSDDGPNKAYIEGLNKKVHEITGAECDVFVEVNQRILSRCITKGTASTPKLLLHTSGDALLNPDYTQTYLVKKVTPDKPVKVLSLGMVPVATEKGKEAQTVSSTLSLDLANSEPLESIASGIQISSDQPIVVTKGTELDVNHGMVQFKSADIPEGAVSAEKTSVSASGLSGTASKKAAEKYSVNDIIIKTTGLCSGWAGAEGFENCKYIEDIANSPENVIAKIALSKSLTAKVSPGEWEDYLNNNFVLKAQTTGGEVESYPFQNFVVLKYDQGMGSGGCGCVITGITATVDNTLLPIVILIFAASGIAMVRVRGRK